MHASPFIFLLRDSYNIISGSFLQGRFGSWDGKLFETWTCYTLAAAQLESGNWEILQATLKL